MSLYITSLNSGSNGNCYYVGNEEEAILVDAGLSCREIERRMNRLQLPLGRVKAVFISHEHRDHIRGITVFSAKHKIPVYITPGTHFYGRLSLRPELVIRFAAYQPLSVGQLSVTAFPKMHDAADPHSFIISSNGVCVGVFTDIGIACEHVTGNFRKCHAAFLEANYDAAMLESGPYPYHLKQRIRGGKGHLSNQQALDLFLEHRPEHMSHILLAHLSKENNNPEKLYELFSSHAGNVHVTVASRDEPSPVFFIKADGSSSLQNSEPAKEPIVQTSLF